MNSLLLALPDLRLNDLSHPLELLLSKVVDPAWASALAANEPFTSKVSAPLELAFESDEASLQVPGGAALKLGGAAGARVSLRLWWPGQAQPKVAERLAEIQLLRGVPRGEDTYWMVLDLGGDSRATVQGGAPVSGLLTATYGLDANGRARLVRVLPLPAATPSLLAVQAMLGSLRWPLGAPRPGSDWRPGEAWLVETDGDLRISIGLQGGYEFTGVEKLELGKLPVSWGCKLAAKISVRAGFTLSGRYLVGLAAGEEPGWTRCVVRRGSVRGVEFGLGVDVVAEAESEDLPEDPEAFLAAALGVELGAAGEWLKLVAESETPATLLAAAQAKLSPRLAAWLTKATDAIVDRTGGEDAFVKVRDSLRAFTAGLKDLPSGVAGWLAGRLEELPRLESQITALIDKLSAENTSRWLDEHELGILWGLGVEKAHEALLDPERLEKLKTQLGSLRTLVVERVDEQVRDWLAELRARSDVKAALSFIERLESAEDLRALVESGLGELAELILEEELPKQLGGAEVAKFYAGVRARVLQVQGLLKRLGELLGQARKAKLELSIGAIFAARGENSTLVDVEINLAHPAGPALAADVCKGDCRALLQHAGRPGAPVRLHRCALESARTRTSTITVSAFGSKWISVSELVERVGKEYVESDEGVLCLYTADTRRMTVNRSDTRRGHELAQSALLLRRLARGRGDEALEFTDFQASLEVLRVQRPASAEAVRSLLEFARTLGMLQDPEEYAARLAAELGDPLGEISATYRVAYRPDVLREALTMLPASTIAEVAIAAIRDYVRVRHGGRFSVNIQAHLAYDLFGGVEATLPDEAGIKRALQRLDRDLLRYAPRRPGDRGRASALGTNAERHEWHEAELECLGLLRRLREELGSAAPDLGRLAAISKGLLSVRAPFLDLQRGNVIFLIFDRLIMAHDERARAGLVSLELAMKPSGSEQRVRRLLVA